MDLLTLQFIGRCLLGTAFVSANGAAILYMLSIWFRPKLELGERILYSLLFLTLWCVVNATIIAFIMQIVENNRVP